MLYAGTLLSLIPVWEQLKLLYAQSVHIKYIFIHCAHSPHTDYAIHFHTKTTVIYCSLSSCTVAHTARLKVFCAMKMMNETFNLSFENSISHGESGVGRVCAESHLLAAATEKLVQMQYKSSAKIM